MSPISDPLLAALEAAAVVGEKTVAAEKDRPFVVHRLQDHIDARRVQQAVQSGG
jgi:hypothetical protein